MKKSIRIFPALLLAGVLSVTAKSAQESVDPFAPGQGEEIPQRDNSPKFISITFETFSVSLADAVSLYNGQPSDTALYKEITSRVAKGKAKQENFVVLRARSGERAALKNTSEFIYPASYLPDTTPAVKPQPAGGVAPKPSNPAAAPAPAAPVPAVAAPTSALPFPTDFKTRDLGLSLVIEPTIGGNDSIIDLRIEPIIVTLADRTKWGPADSGIETPVFEVQSLSTANTMLTGQTQLLGTMSRPPASKADAEATGRIWFAFVTPKILSVPRH
ncbi:hypothetical protein [Luteolibacter soli]|uniref:Uncharacterized protein n=1 Tax=Luteolibacter soli TaxID=3135280 RepID=A0ABU9AVF8_9BACT